ncbi:MAG: hypothetical protein WC858_00380 [Parcubacteria group bacterium]|jgi:hypothetical protein
MNKYNGNLLVDKTAYLVLFMRSLYSKSDSLASRFAQFLDVNEIMATHVLEHVRAKWPLANFSMIADKTEEIRHGIYLLSPIIEVRTLVTQILAYALGFNHICGLGAGLSPSLIEMAQQSNKIAFHTDLSMDVLKHLEVFIEGEFQGKIPCNLVLHPLDILNKSKMRELCRILRGYCVFFYTEGVLQYFNLGMKDQFFDAITMVLSELPGSILVTQDIRSKKDVQSILSLDETARLVVELVAGMTGVKIIKNSYDSHRDAEDNILRGRNLKIQTLRPFDLIGDRVSELNSLNLPGIDAERTIERLKDRRIYVISSAK